jgi:hypothetical protein
MKTQKRRLMWHGMLQRGGDDEGFIEAAWHIR